MYVANYWGPGPGNGALPKYIAAAFKLYRNYDGKQGTYGDTAVTAATAMPADIAKASIYAATDSKHPGVLTVLVINRELATIWDGKIAIKGGSYGKAQVYALDGTSPDIRAMPDVEVKAGVIDYRLPPLSATLFVCHAK
jgi:mannan endo-1,4-beta-mannosidase